MNKTLEVNENLKKAMQKTKRKMTLRIIKIFIVCLAIVMLIINIPNLLYFTQHARINEAQKVMMLTHQLSSNQNVVGYSESINKNLSLNREISLYTRNVVGHNYSDSEQINITVPYNLISRKLDLYYPLMSSFMHQSKFDLLEEKYKQQIIADNNRYLESLEKNRDTTVSRVDITFPISYSIEEVYEFIGDFDIEIQWFAIETGYESSDPPDYMSMPLQQYCQFGIPSAFYTPDTIFDPIIIQKDNIQAHIELVFETLGWLQAHDDLFYKERFWFMNENLEEKLKSDGMMCYGITVNAPTDQIVLLLKTIEYNHLNLQGMTFWNW